MKYLQLLTVLAAICVLGFDTPTRVPNAYARPENTIDSYWHSMLEHHHRSALDCFTDASYADVERMVPLPQLVELRCRDYQVADRGRGQVDVLYTVEYRVGMCDSLASFATGDRLQFTNRGWKIHQPLFIAEDRH